MHGALRLRVLEFFGSAESFDGCQLRTFLGSETLLLTRAMGGVRRHPDGLCAQSLAFEGFGWHVYWNSSIVYVN